MITRAPTIDQSNMDFVYGEEDGDREGNMEDKEEMEKMEEKKELEDKEEREKEEEKREKEERVDSKGEKYKYLKRISRLTEEDCEISSVSYVTSRACSHDKVVITVLGKR